MINVTIFNEFLHEQNQQDAKDMYPKGIHNTIAEFLGEEADINVRTVTLYDENLEIIPDCGITSFLMIPM